MVSDEPVPHLKHYRFPGTAQFDEDIRYLGDHFGFLGYEELLRRRLGGAPTLDNSATITFDDGFSQCDEVARPILARHGAKAIFFVITDLIDNRMLFRETQASLCMHALLNQPAEAVADIAARVGIGGNQDFAATQDGALAGMLRLLRDMPPTETETLAAISECLGIDAVTYLHKVQPYLTTAQIGRLVDAGFTIGAHSCSHRRLQDMPRAEAEQEIVQSCQVVRELTGQDSIPFAFPYDGSGLDRGWLAQIRRRDPSIGLFFDTAELARDAPFIVQRISGERDVGESMNYRLRSAWSRRVAWHRG